MNPVSWRKWWQPSKCPPPHLGWPSHNPFSRWVVAHGPKNVPKVRPKKGMASHDIDEEFPFGIQLSSFKASIDLVGGVGLMLGGWWEGNLKCPKGKRHAHFSKDTGYIYIVIHSFSVLKNQSLKEIMWCSVSEWQNGRATVGWLVSESHIFQGHMTLDGGWGLMGLIIDGGFFVVGSFVALWVERSL